MATDDQEKAEVLAEYFGSVFTIDHKIHLPDVPTPLSITSILHTIDINTDILKKKLSMLLSNKAPGPDEISRSRWTEGNCLKRGNDADDSIGKPYHPETYSQKTDKKRDYSKMDLVDLVYIYCPVTILRGMC